jgi:Xaa-Pro dipeptidase
MLHFTQAEFDRRLKAARFAMSTHELDAMLLFAPESHYWLTGYDTFGYCFFQCMILTSDDVYLLTRSADLRQAQITSTVQNIHIWRDAQGANPASDLRKLLDDLKLLGSRFGVETNTHGLTAFNGQRLYAALEDQELVEASHVISSLRLVKSDEELTYVRRAANLADDALDAAMEATHAGAQEGHILSKMQGAIFEGDGDYPGNEFIIGSGENALLCRYQTARRPLDATDQLTLEWAGAYRHYHAAMMRTLIVGAPTQAHLSMQDAAEEALLACEAALVPGQPMGAVFDAHARVLDARGFAHARLNACGYSLGARFSPSWMEDQMFYDGAETVMAPGMVFFLHMILMDSEAGAAVCLGRTSLITGEGSDCLSRHGTELLLN